MAVGALVFSPIFCSGIIFAQLFARAEKPDQALAYNAAGAILGGLLENSSRRAELGARAKALIEQHGGSFFVVSEKDAGTTVTFTLPENAPNHSTKEHMS